MLPVGVLMMRPSATAVVRTRGGELLWRDMVMWVKCGEAPRCSMISLRAWSGVSSICDAMGFCASLPPLVGGWKETRRRLRSRIRAVRVGPRDAPKEGSQVAAEEFSEDSEARTEDREDCEPDM